MPFTRPGEFITLTFLHTKPWNKICKAKIWYCRYREGRLVDSEKKDVPLNRGLRWVDDRLRAETLSDNWMKYFQRFAKLYCSVFFVSTRLHWPLRCLLLLNAFGMAFRSVLCFFFFTRMRTKQTNKTNRLWRKKHSKLLLSTQFNEFSSLVGNTPNWGPCFHSIDTITIYRL